MDWFWAEHFWLPENTRWSDVSNGVDKNVVYAEVQDLWILLPLTVGTLLFRYMIEQYCFASVGRWLNVPDARKKTAPANPVLEAAYTKSSICADPVSLAKQLDMTERQVERWWRLRRSQDKPSTLVKFCESMWKLVYYFCSVSFGFYVLWDKEWFWDINKTFSGYPHQGITRDVWWYYMISSAFCWSLAVSQFWDVKRKDFWQIFMHHIATVALIFCSWVCNLHRVGTLIFILHDPSEVLLELSKVVKYARIGDITPIFVLFTLIWIVTRVILFPLYILPLCFTYVRVSPAMFILYIFLCILLLLHISWTWLILKISYKTVVSGKEPEDTRSSSSEGD